MTIRLSSLLLPFLALSSLPALSNAGTGESDDLMSFVTRPDIRAPKFEVTQHNKDLISPGYWFVAPYPSMAPEPRESKWSPCQIGPHIYDGDGSLIWSGACLWDNRNVFDFKAVNHIDDNGEQHHLTFLVQHDYEDDGLKGVGIVLNQEYDQQSLTPVVNDLWEFNIHEYNVLPGGRSALACAYRSERLDLGQIGMPAQQGMVLTGGIEEIDVATGEVLFEWRGLDHVPLSDNNKGIPVEPPDDSLGWDYIHLNSVDKNSDGDYLVSARFTDAIYLISGQDGQIVWTLGGPHSSFVQDFAFFRQHDARFISHNETHTTISLLNNASDEDMQTEDVSSAMYILLDRTTVPMQASLITRYNRPDNSLSRLRGNVQTLPDGNVFVGWSEQGYHSEYAANGSLAMEAWFVSKRYSSYRSYKSEFVGKPTEPPALKSFVFGTDVEDVDTVIYISWNGATEVDSYRFFAKADESRPSVSIGDVKRSGFESMFVAEGYMDWISVEALDADGNILGKSGVERTVVPEKWLATGFKDAQLMPQDPVHMYDASVADADTRKNNHTITYAFTKEWYSPDWAFRVLALIGALTVVIFFGGLVTGCVLLVMRTVRFRRQRQYKEVPPDEEVEGEGDTEMDRLAQSEE